MNEAFWTPILLTGAILFLIFSVYARYKRGEDIGGWIVFFVVLFGVGGGGLAALYFFPPFPDGPPMR